jgi:hypothetical protein
MPSISVNDAKLIAATRSTGIHRPAARQRLSGLSAPPSGARREPKHQLRHPRLSAKSFPASDPHSAD